MHYVVVYGVTRHPYLNVAVINLCVSTTRYTHASSRHKLLTNFIPHACSNSFCDPCATYNPCTSRRSWCVMHTCLHTCSPGISQLGYDPLACIHHSVSAACNMLDSTGCIVVGQRIILLEHPWLTERLACGPPCCLVCIGINVYGVFRWGSTVFHISTLVS